MTEGPGIYVFRPRPWRPRATQALLAANVGVFLAMWATGVDPGTPETEALVRWGANAPQKVLAGEWWRLLTSMFLHVGALHLLMNMFGLWYVGAFLERVVGRPAFLVVYLLSGLVGSLASTATHDYAPSAGASGALFGVLGGLLAFTLRRGREWLMPSEARRLLRNLLLVIAVNVALGLTVPGIDNAAHMGGLAGGLVSGVFVSLPLTPAGFAARPRRAAAVGLVGLVAIAGLAAGLHAVRPAGHVWGARDTAVRAALDQADRGQRVALDALDRAFEAWEAGTMTDASFAAAIDRDVLFEWRRAWRPVERLREVPREAEHGVALLVKRAESVEKRLDGAVEALHRGDRRAARTLLNGVGPVEVGDD